MDNEILSILMSLKEEIGGINNKLDKNTLMLEELNNKIGVIAEAQTSFSEQLDRAKNKDGKSLADRLNLIELAITDTSSRTKDIQKDLSRVVRATAENWAEIVELKAVK